MPEFGQIKTLTTRERAVLEMIVGGLPAREIANRLGIAPRTVEGHVDQLRLKTGSRNRAHMAAVAVRAGLVAAPRAWM
ncbi:MAG: response regulator transcription factor [Sphingomonas sp.]